MDQSYYQELERLGLSDAESRVYLAALQLGGSYVSVLAKHADVERTNCYHILKTLGEKGLISTASKDGRKYYLPESPKKLLTECTTRVQIAERLVPNLLALENTGSPRAPKVRYFEGQDAISDVLIASLESETEIVRYTNIKQLSDKFPDSLPEYCAGLAARGTRTRIVSSFHPDIESFVYERFPESYLKRSLQLLYVNPREFFLENEVTVYDDKVSIISLSPKEHIAVIIESQVYADTSRATFELAWLGRDSV